MQKTPNYGLDIYEPNDVTSYLTTYNQTMVKIDADLKQIDDMSVKNGTDIAGLETQVTNAQDEINNLTAEVSDNTEQINGHGAQIAAINQKVNQQDIAIEQIRTELSGAAAQFYSGVLSTNETTLAIPIGEHIDNLVVMPTCSVYGLSPITLEVRAASGGQPNLIVTTWDAQAADVNVTMVVWDRN